MWLREGETARMTELCLNDNTYFGFSFRRKYGLMDAIL